MIRRWIVIALLVSFGLAAALSVSARADAVQLVLWHSEQNGVDTALQALIAAFERTHPYVTIDAVYSPSTDLNSAFMQAAPDQRPDMLLASNDHAGAWANAGLLKDLSVSIPDDLRAQASDTAWGLFRYRDGLYGIPYSGQTLAFFYNQAFVSAAPANWADVLTRAQQIHAEHPQVTGLAFQNSFFQSAGFLFALGGQLMDFDGNPAFGADADGAGAMDAYLQFLEDMAQRAEDANSGVVIDASSPNPRFAAGTVAMIYDGLWNLAQYESALGDKLRVSLMPSLDNGSVPAMFAQGDGFYLSASADDTQKQAFLDWGKFVTSPAGQMIAVRQAGILPVNPAVRFDDPKLQVFAEQFALGTPLPNSPESWWFLSFLNDTIMSVMSGKEPPDQARQDAYTTIQRSIDILHNATPEATTSP